MARYIIYGAGAIGSILGAELSCTGQEVVLVARPAHVQAILRDGLQVKSKAAVRSIKIKAVIDLAQIHPGSDDRVLVTVKTQQTSLAAGQLTSVFPRNTIVASLQNAVRNEEILTQGFERVYGGLVEFSGTFVSPGRVVHTRNDLVAIGNFPRGFDSHAESVAADLERAGFRVERSQDVMAIKWWKLKVVRPGLFAGGTVCAPPS